MARAYEQSGDLESALKTLDRLVKDYPATRYASEAQFRRGELLFTAKDYAGAEKAFATVLAAPDANPYRDRSLYMQGWSQYKQGRLEDGLKSFFGVLDIKIAGQGGETGLETIAGLTPRRPRAGRGHVPRHQHQPGQPAGRRVDPAVHDDADEEDLRVPRLRAARRALHQAGARQGRGRHLQPVRPQATRCMRRRR